MVRSSGSSRALWPQQLGSSNLATAVDLQLQPGSFNPSGSQGALVLSADAELQLCSGSSSQELQLQLSSR